MAAKPFALLQTRPEDAASDNEYAAFLRYGGLSPHELVRIRLEREPLPQDFRVEAYAGILVGGGPFNASDPASTKGAAQVRAEHELARVLDTVVARDTPYLGTCYGLGVLIAHEQACVSKERYSEGAGGVTIFVTDAGTTDPLLAGLPRTFRAFGGHKEACQTLPANAVLLARSDSCPVQMLRIGENVYATQFHTELDQEGIRVRIDVYRHAGYFPPEEADALQEQMLREVVTEPMHILQRFVERAKEKR